jgi:hypothetical protein
MKKKFSMIQAWPAEKVIGASELHPFLRQRFSTRHYGCSGSNDVEQSLSQ